MIHLIQCLLITNLFPALVTDISEGGSASSGSKADPDGKTSTDKGKDKEDTVEIPTEISILAHIDMVREVGFDTDNLQVGAYIKLEKGYNATLVSEEIREVFSFNSSVSVISIDDMVSDFSELTTTKVIITIFCWSAHFLAVRLAFTLNPTILAELPLANFTSSSVISPTPAFKILKLTFS